MESVFVVSRLDDNGIYGDIGLYSIFKSKKSAIDAVKDLLKRDYLWRITKEPGEIKESIYRTDTETIFYIDGFNVEYLITQMILEN